jgi:hypothetical protein
LNEPTHSLLTPSVRWGVLGRWRRVMLLCRPPCAAEFVRCASDPEGNSQHPLHVMQQPRPLARHSFRRAFKEAHAGLPMLGHGQGALGSKLRLGSCVKRAGNWVLVVWGKGVWALCTGGLRRRIGGWGRKSIYWAPVTTCKVA